MKIRYSTNNSGGDWWLSDKDWHDLESNGWSVKWIKDEPFFSDCKDGRWLGTLAKEASKDFKNMPEAIEEWEKITGQNSSDEGCNCCGVPHLFYYE